MPRGAQVSIVVRSSQDVDLEIWPSRANSVIAPRGKTLLPLATSARRGTGREGVVVATLGSRGVFVFVNVLPRTAEADYTLTITTARSRR